MDVIAWSGGIGRASYVDYAIPTAVSSPMDLWVALHPDLSTRPEISDAILNGLEVFKLQDYYGNSSINGFKPPLPAPVAEPNVKSGGSPAVVGGVVGSSAALLIACIGVCTKREGNKGIFEDQVLNSSNSVAIFAAASPSKKSRQSPVILTKHFSWARVVLGMYIMER
jgi:hypothetical protein